MTSWVSGMLAAAALLLGAQAAEATTFYSFTGSVDDPGALGSQFHAGDTLHFRLAIDTSQTGVPFFGSTFYAGERLSGRFSNGYAFSLTPTVRVQPSGDVVVFGGMNTGGASVGPYDPVNADFFIYAPIADGSLPNFVDLYPLSTSTVFAFYFQGPTDTRVTGHLTGAAPATTPIPATLPLFIAALGGLAVVGWGRRKRARPCRSSLAKCGDPKGI